MRYFDINMLAEIAGVHRDTIGRALKFDSENEKPRAKVIRMRGVRGVRIAEKDARNFLGFYFPKAKFPTEEVLQ